jgi:hypothetical protein
MQEQACSEWKAGAHFVFQQVHHGKWKVIARKVAIELSIPNGLTPPYITKLARKIAEGKYCKLKGLLRMEKCGQD